MTTNRRRQVGLFPGTFDPIHFGHTALANESLRAGLDEVWFIVDPKVQSSPGEQKQPATPLEHRLAMVHYGLADQPGLILYDGPLVQHPHTPELFGEIMSHFKDFEFSFVMGVDTFNRLPNWKGVESVVKNSTIMVGDRLSPEDGLVSRLDTFSPGLTEALKVKRLSLGTNNSLSSTKVREQLIRNQQPMQISSAVYNYLRKNELYR